jgi:integrase
MSIEARVLKSGRTVYDVRLRDPYGRLYKRTFRTKREAERFRATELTDRARGAWVDPRRGKVTLEQYGRQWLSRRPDLRPRTRELYEGLLRLHILPALGELEIGAVTTQVVRAWRAQMLAAPKPGVSTTEKCYRLLRAILNTAVQDEAIAKNPCTIKGAGTERPAERPTLTVPQVYALADAIAPEFRALVLAGTFCGLRLGELLALRRRHIDLLHGRLTVAEQAQELRDGTVWFGPPKTEAGRRTVAVPPHVLPELEFHLDSYVGSGPDALLFAGPDGDPVLRMRFYRAWRNATVTAGFPGVRPHDLRHTGNTLAAATGASTRELMARLGHASPRAALIYQHATEDRDDALAKAISDLITGQGEPRATVRQLLPRRSGE